MSSEPHSIAFDGCALRAELNLQRYGKPEELQMNDAQPKQQLLYLDMRQAEALNVVLGCRSVRYAHGDDGHQIVGDQGEPRTEKVDFELRWREQASSRGNEIPFPAFSIASAPHPLLL